MLCQFSLVHKTDIRIVITTAHCLKHPAGWKTVRGVYSIEAWTQPASLKKRGGTKIMHIFDKTGGRKIKGGRKTTRKLCYRKDAPYRPTWVPWKFSGIPDYAHGYYSQHFSWAFVRIDSINVPTKFEVRSFTRAWDNREYPKKLGTPRIRPRSLSPKFSISFYSDCPCKCTRQIWSP